MKTPTRPSNRGYERTRGSANGRPFNVQEFFVEVAKNDRPLNGYSPSRLVFTLRASPVYEILAASWNPPPAAQADHADAVDPADSGANPVDAESSDSP